MTEKEVKEKIGEENWGKFCKWMTGQTIGTTKDGDVDYYACDVDAFIVKTKTGYDRQSDPIAWD